MEFVPRPIAAPVVAYVGRKVVVFNPDDAEKSSEPKKDIGSADTRDKGAACADPAVAKIKADNATYDNFVNLFIFRTLSKDYVELIFLFISSYYHNSGLKFNKFQIFRNLSKIMYIIYLKLLLLFIIN